MLHHYLRVVFRNMLRNKVYTGITILGLTLGMAAFLLISGYVSQEQGYDRIHPNGDRIYRAESLFFKEGQKVSDWPTSTNGLAPALKEAFPEVEAFTRINWRGSTRVVQYQQTKFREEHVCFADSNFFTFFAYPVVQGDRNTFLKAPNTVVIAESAARRYFGHADPMGKYLVISTQSETLHCQVTGVFADLPANSTMQFSMLLSWSTSPEWTRNFWYQHESYSFVRLRPNADPTAVAAKFPALAEKYKTADAMRDQVWGVQLVPLHDLHLNPAKPNEVEGKGNRRAVQALGAMAFIILLIGWINYVNLSTARAMDRAREVGIRKSVGSHKSSLIFQFLFESALFNGLALVLAVLLALLAQYLLPTYLGIRLSLANWLDRQQLGLLLLIFGVGTVLAGLYPALVLAGVKPTLALKGKYRFSAGGALLRQGLVIAQFTASMVLIVGTFVAYRQLDYMMKQDLGVAIDQVLVLRAPVNTDQYDQKIQSFKNTLKTVGAIKEVTSSGSVPGREVGQMLANRRLHAQRGQDRSFEMLTIDYDFIKTFGLKLVAGRDFDRNRPADQYGLILNESSVRQFGFPSSEAAIGEKILLESTPNRPNEIIGVVRDYHQQALQQKFTPLILFMDPDYRWLPTDYYSLKIATDDVSGLVDKVGATWNQFFPQSSMDYFFLDDFFNRQYQQDRQLSRSFLLFSSLAILIACMGLFGLTSYSTARRTKEIGIRKTLGASVSSILSLLTWDTLRLVLLAALLAVPLSGYLVDQWLSGYAFKVGLNPTYWLLPMLILTGIALSTISYLTIKAALANPTKSLRSE